MRTEIYFTGFKGWRDDKVSLDQQMNAVVTLFQDKAKNIKVSDARDGKAMIIVEHAMNGDIMLTHLQRQYNNSSYKVVENANISQRIFPPPAQEILIIK